MKASGSRKTSFRSIASLHGFTMVEVLFVVSIATVLAGLLLPALGNMVSSANRAKCQSNLRQITAALFSYTADHNGVFPVAAPHELGGKQGRVGGDAWLPGRMFGGSLPAEQRPLNTYLDCPEVFRSPCDRGEPLWWFDTAEYQKTSTCYELYGSSYFYASGYNRMIGVLAPMGIAKVVGPEFSHEKFAQNPVPLGEALRMNSYPNASKKVIIGSIPIHRTMSGVVAVSERAQWYKRDPDALWATAAFLDGHVEFVRVFPYDPGYQSVGTPPNENNPYY